MWSSLKRRVGKETEEGARDLALQKACEKAQKKGAESLRITESSTEDEDTPFQMLVFSEEQVYVEYVLELTYPDGPPDSSSSDSENPEGEESRKTLA